MKTVSEIKNEMTAVFMANPDIQSKYGLDPSKTFEQQFSRVSLESLIFYIVAFCHWIRQKLFSSHVKEVQDIIDNKRPHHARWYSNKAKAFQYGFNLLPESDKFDNSGKTEDEIKKSKVVAFASAVERDRKLLLKLAKDDEGNLAPLEEAELSSFRTYMERVKDAGVELEYLSDKPEELSIELTIYYNPLVLNTNGERLDGKATAPVADALRNYLSLVGFDGIVVLAFLTDMLQSVDGVVIPHIEKAQYKYGDLEWETFDVMRQPLSGYMRIKDEDLSVKYVPHNAVL